MAPPAPINCSAANCNYVTPAEAATISQALQFLSLHVQAAHPAPVAAVPGPRPTTKVEHWTRPEINLDTSERDWRFFLAEWDDYKRATGVTGLALLDELWSCMASDLKKLAFDQGGRTTLNTEQLMLDRIKGLAVTVLHSAVHTVHLHDSKQQAEESTKAFAARVRGTAASCELTKLCPSPGCNTNVSFMEETVYNVTLAGLRDRDMQERCLAAAYMKTVTNIQELIQFCSAEESSKKSGPDTVGALRTSTYKQAKKEKGKQNQGNNQNSKRRCDGCGGPGHSGLRQEQCKAWGKTCKACGKSNHIEAACRGGKPAASGRNSAIEPSQQPSQPSGGELATWQTDEGASYAFCALNASREGDDAGSEAISATPAARAPDHYLQSYSPPEYRGLSPGPAVPILPLDEQSRFCSATGCQALSTTARDCPYAASCYQKTYSPPEYRGLSPGSEVPILPIGAQKLSPLSSGCQTGGAALKGRKGDDASSEAASATPATRVPDYYPQSYSPPEYRGLSSGSEVPMLSVGVQKLSPPSSGAALEEAKKDDAGSEAASAIPADPGVLTPKSYSPPEHRGLSPGQIIPTNAVTSNLTPEISAVLAGLATQAATLPLCHMEFKEDARGVWRWNEQGPLASPRLPVKLEVHTTSYKWLNLPIPKPMQGSIDTLKGQAVPDTGAQMDVCGINLLHRMGIDRTSLFPVQARIFGASRDAQIDIIGGILLLVSDPDEHTGKVSRSTVRLFYVATNVTSTYLSLATLKALGVVEPSFPKFAALGRAHGALAASTASLPPCTNSGVVMPTDQPCSCPKRELPSSTPASLPCPPTEENLPKLKQWLLDRYASSTFNVCEHQPLPMMKSSPPLQFHVDPKVTPKAVHKPSLVPLHWQEPVLAGLIRDCKLNVLERVPLNTPVGWQSRMVVTAKTDGSPRRVVDYQEVNKASPRQTHHTPSPWLLVSSIPPRVRKSCFDAWHGYHSLPLATEADRAATTFITPWGRFRYKTCPQGFLSAGDGYSDRMDRLLEHVERKRRCIDDTLLFDNTIEEAFFRACEFLDLCGKNGVVLSPKKFQFAEETVDFVGFTVTSSGVQPTKEFMASIMDFPTPASLTDVRSWFGAVAQVSYTFATSPVMQPLRHLLSSKAAFSWSPELDAAFQASKVEVAKQCHAGVRSFDPALTTAVATDWCKTAMGVWMTQKHCKCPKAIPGCCKTGWQTVYVGSRFCTGAESRYSPICGEAAGAAWGVDKCKFFLLGLPDFLLCLDHRPLLKIFSASTELGDISNPRLYNQKVRLLPYRFTTIFVPGKDHVTPDCFSRRSDFPAPEQAPVPQSPDLLDIANVSAAYSSSFSPPTWVSQPESERTWPAEEAGVLAFLTSHPMSSPSPSEEESTHAVEAQVAHLGQSSLIIEQDEDLPNVELEALEVASLHQQRPVSMVTWSRLQASTAASPLCQKLIKLINSGLPEDKTSWPEELRAYYPFRNHLISTDGVIMCGERPLIPPDLQPEILEHLHAAHHGASRMLSRAGQSVFWPNLKAAVIAHREQCKSCSHRAPSQPAPPPTAPVQPDFPFSHVVADFFQVDATYLAMADRYSNWLSIFQLKKDDSANIIQTFRQYFSRWGVAKNVTTDGASVFTSHAMKDFFERWGVQHRVSSSYYPRANKRAEVAVKSAKRLVMENLGPRGSLDTDRFARALLAHRNNPDPETGVSPAQVIFGRELRDHLPALVSRYQPRQEWRLEADLRERALAKRHGRMEQRLQHGARVLPPLSCGDTVVLQDLQTNDGKPGRWTKSGEVVEVLPYDAYLVRVHGSRAVTQRNRRFLRKMKPFSPALPFTSDDCSPDQSRVITRAMMIPSVQEPSRLATPTPPTTSSPAVPTVVTTPTPVVPTSAVPSTPLPGPSAIPPAELYRQRPIGPPGADLVDLLKRREMDPSNPKL